MNTKDDLYSEVFFFLVAILVGMTLVYSRLVLLCRRSGCSCYPLLLSQVKLIVLVLPSVSEF